MKKFQKIKKISEFKEGEFVDDIFIVKFKKGINKYANGFYFELILADNSGNITYKYWGSNDEAKINALYDSIKPDSIVHVQGKVSLYKDKLQLVTNEPFVFEVLNEGQYDKSDFINPPRKDIDLMFKKIIEAINSVKNEKIKKLLYSIFTDREIENRFKTHPGAIEIHHNWIGGLLEHTIEVLEYCEKSFEIFPKLNRDILIAGALLHDLGKLEEIEITSRIKGTNLGQMVGHLTLGAVLVSKKCDELHVEEDIKNKLLHIIVSHHGKLEFGSPKEPMFPEALIIYYADELSSKVSEMLEFIKNAKESTEDDFMFNKRNGKNILLK